MAVIFTDSVGNFTLLRVILLTDTGCCVFQTTRKWNFYLHVWRLYKL